MTVYERTRGKRYRVALAGAVLVMLQGVQLLDFE